VVCDGGGRSAGLVLDPNGAQSRWLGLGHQSRPQVLGPGEHSREGEDRSGGAARANGSAFSTVRDRRFTENESGGYLISFPDFPGVVASGALPEEEIQRGRDAFDVFRSTMRRAEIPKARG
jgi:predicted RNase H-like HicB family nuclease